jgi:hypothetical protein
MRKEQRSKNSPINQIIDEPPQRAVPIDAITIHTAILYLIFIGLKYYIISTMLSNFTHN